VNDPAIIPRPRRLELRPGSLALAREATLSYADAASAAGRLCAETVGRPARAALQRVAEGATIRLVLDAGAAGRHVVDTSAGGAAPRPSDPGSNTSRRLEGYRISIDEERVLAVSGSAAGLCNAVQTLRQLLAAEAFLPAPLPDAGLTLPCVEIEDEPAFSWRGGQLDVARHMMPESFLFRFVDLLAMHKLNVLHLHLTDDQGWRLPSRRWPRLEEVGAWRRETLVGHPLDPARATAGPVFDGTPHGGSYSAKTLAALVRYAAERNVTVLPEIDLPGHVQAAVAAYPELGSASGAVEVLTSWGISNHVLNCSDVAMGFCADVVDELLETFPSSFVHLGGDECPRTEWREHPGVRARIAELGLAGPDALQGWFTAQMAVLLAERGRRLVGWDEIVECGPLPAGATVMSWRGEQGGIDAARAGFDVVMCPAKPCYFDHYQSGSPDEPLAIFGLNTLEAVHSYRPVPTALAPEAAEHVLGTQFQLWSEYLPDPQAVEYMAFPRAAALAEVAWSGPGGELGEFTHRLAQHLRRLDALGVNYRPLGGPRPWQRGGSGARHRVDPVR
jgi:hexosaminidase